MCTPSPLRLLLAGCLLANAGVAAESKAKTRNVVLIVSDGLRWQEVFNGADPSLLNREHGGVSDPDPLRKAFVRESAEESREALLPFFWSAIAQQGQLYGNHAKGAVARVTNGLKFSYPGYNELLTGYPDPRIDSNEAGPNPNVTVFEWLNRLPEFRGRVVAFGAWDVFADIFNRERSGLFVQAGWQLSATGKRAPRLDLLDELFRTTTRYSPLFEDAVYNSFLHAAVKEFLRQHSPRVIFVGYAETDGWAHAGRYDLYLRSVHQFDGFVADLWNILQSRREYRDKTTFLITTDHGRGRSSSDWNDHGKGVEGAEETWIAILGPDTPALGERTKTSPVTQAQIAATLAALLGKDYQRGTPAAAPPIREAIKGSH